jgi:hypothetical protein
VILESESTARPARCGTIQEVVHEQPSPRYRIRWDDGHESIYTPAAGALRAVEQQPAPSRRRRPSSYRGSEAPPPPS